LKKLEQKYIKMNYKYLIYFSDELDGRSYKVGDENSKIIINRLFENLNIQSFTYDKTKTIIIVVTTKRLDMGIFNSKQNSLQLKFKSGLTIRPYILSEITL